MGRTGRRGDQAAGSGGHALAGGGRLTRDDKHAAARGARTGDPSAIAA
ncbi:hypothetical protein DM47_3529 [Burkholderia mallei]|nr:hypothetical protein DM47_3529 [Burkholderia mallei]